MVSQENPRRRFLVNAGKTTVLAAVGTGMVLSSSLAADPKAAKKEVIRGKSKKVEILYQKTAAWEDYYKRAF